MAERIGAHLGVVPSQHAELRELDFGQWEGLTYEGIMTSDRAIAESWYENAFELAPPGGETLLELGARIDRWVARVQRCTDSADTILVVSHGGPIRWFISRYVLGDERAYWQVEGVKPGGLVVADCVENRWQLVEIDKTSAD
jgi:alpha-ribazole phosphatase